MKLLTVASEPICLAIPLGGIPLKATTIHPPLGHHSVTHILLNMGTLMSWSTQLGTSTPEPRTTSHRISTS
ncbi:hypothetical protein LINPERPRIM_LOCUS21392 [Linum perenne]